MTVHGNSSHPTMYNETIEVWGDPFYPRKKTWVLKGEWQWKCYWLDWAVVKNLRLFRPNGLLVSPTKDSLQFITILPIYLYNQPRYFRYCGFSPPQHEMPLHISKTGSDTFLEGFNGHHDTYDTFQTQSPLQGPGRCRLDRDSPPSTVLTPELRKEADWGRVSAKKQKMFSGLWSPTFMAHMLDIWRCPMFDKFWSLQPPEIEHDTQKKEIEDVSPIKNGDFPLSHWFFLAGIFLKEIFDRPPSPPFHTPQGLHNDAPRLPGCAVIQGCLNRPKCW